MTNFWPFWVTAPVLGVITVSYWILLRRPLGVSGVVARFSRVQEELQVDRGFEALEADRAALEAAMLAMTAEAFGSSSSTFDPAVAPSASPGAEPVFEAPAGRVCAPTPSLREHAIFLVAIAAGGLLASLLRGSFGAAGMGEPFARLVGPGAGGLAALAAGGVLVGFGASLCGGCTAGHGLTGSGRLMPGSLVSTALFFATAIGVSFLLAGLA